MKTYYAGIGSRSTPPIILKKMYSLAVVLSRLGIILRSGGAEGADTAFEAGANHICEIYLPSPTFGYNPNRIHSYPEPTYSAMVMASKHHPRWQYLKPYVQKLHARNCHQILGRNLDEPSKFVICWTSDKCESNRNRTVKTGGTGMAIAIADEYDIPVFNLANEDRYDELLDFIANINTE
jgi:hypothetical protein